MASIVVAGDTSGTVTLSAPATAGTTTLTLPTTSGTIVTTSGAQTIEFADGSASTPSITNSGDTNTGMFFPAADTIAFAEGGTEAMRLDSSGNVGIGTTSPTNRLHVFGPSDDYRTALFESASTAGPSVQIKGSRIYELRSTNTGAGEGAGLFFIYDKTAEASRITINSSGIVTMPFQPAFYGYRSAGNVSATTTVLHNVVVTNIGSCYNSGTGIFTCPVAGVYEIYAGGHAENSQPTVLNIQLNGTTVAQEYSNGASYGVVSLMAIISCAANDQIKSVVGFGTFWGGDPSGLKMTVKLIG
jgi:hypothetical protein